MPYKIKASALVLAAAIGFSASSAAAQEFFIANGDVTGLIDAINAANADPDPAVIHLANNGIYTLITTAQSSTGTPQITSEITFNGNGATIQRSLATGTPEFRIFTLAATANVTMNDLTIRRGFNRAGAGISNSGELTLNNCTITDNVIQGSSAGGGIGNVGKLTINQSLIANNQAGRGAGIDSAGAEADVTITDSVITGNTATSSSGGGIYNSVSAAGSGGIMTIINSTIIDNATTGPNGHGGGIYNVGQLTVTGSQILDNTANLSGGGIYATRTGAAFLDVSDTLISGNTAQNDGGGVLTWLGSTTLDGVTITGNTADGNGGGIIHVGTSSNQVLTITNSLITGNTATSGGGIHSSRPVFLLDSVVRENTAPAGGGGIAHTNNPLTVERSTIADNFTDGDGGGILVVSGSTITIDASTISGNSADGDGGGIRRQGLNTGRITATNSTISGNTAAGVGGGINLVATGVDRIHLVNCTVYDNTANEGGGVHSSGSNSGVRITNSIVAGSVGGDIVGPYVDVIFNIVEDGIGLTNPTSMSGDPMLGPLADNGGSTLTHALLPGSIAIDAGDCSVSAGPDFTPVTADQRGMPRPMRNACDIGAFELECPADWNRDGIVDSDDLFDFLTDWAAGNADYNGDGVTDSDDLFDFLTDWASGC